MKNLIKKHSKVVLFAGVCLFSFESFSASEATKKLIHETLAKYGISAGGKEVCETGHEPEYNKVTGVVKCKNDKQGDTNNCWDSSSRLCKECPYTTVVSPRDYVTCRKIICPKDWKLVEVKDGQCPTGYKLKNIIKNSCDAGFKSYTEQDATNNYTTLSTNCNNVKK